MSGQLPPKPYRYPDNCLPRKIGPWLGLGFGSSLGLALELEGNQTIAPEEYFFSVRVGVKVRVSFGVGGNFPMGQLF